MVDAIPDIETFSDDSVLVYDDGACQGSRADQPHTHLRELDGTSNVLLVFFGWHQWNSVSLMTVNAGEGWFPKRTVSECSLKRTVMEPPPARSRLLSRSCCPPDSGGQFG